MPKRLSDQNTVLLSTKAPQSIADAVDDFRRRRSLRSRSEAVRMILEHGLVADGVLKPKAVDNTNVRCLHSIARRIGNWCSDCQQTVK